MKRYLSILGFFLLFFIVGCTTTTIEISFETNGGETIEPLAIKSMDDLMLPTPVKTNYIFLGWYEDSTFTIPFDSLKVRDSYVFTLYARWVPANGFPVIIHHHLENVDGTYTLHETSTDTIDTTTLALDISSFVKTYAGYEIKSDLTTHTQNEQTYEFTFNFYYERQTYTITFSSPVGEPLASITLKHGHAIEAPNPPEVKGFTFDQFNPMIPETMPMENITIALVWTEKDKVTVTFDTSNAPSIDPISDYIGYPLTLPTDPYKAGYEFVGWYRDAAYTTLFDTETLLSEAITLYAKFNPVLTSYHINHYVETLTGTYVLSETTLKHALTDSTVTVTPKDIIGFEYNPNHNLDFSVVTVLPDESTLANLYYTRKSYQIQFESNAAFSIDTISLKYEETVNEPADPIREHYTFLGWYTDSTFLQKFTFETPMPGYSFVLYAQWLGESMTLQFNTMGGSDVESIIAPLDSVITQPENPIKDGYLFAGWFEDLTYTTEFTDWLMPLGNKTLYAQWTPAIYQLSFESNGGTEISPLDLTYGSTINLPNEPSKTDYLFIDWYLDAALTQPFYLETMPNNDVTLYAKWISSTESNTLYFISQESSGTYVSVEGVVFAKALHGYYSVFIADETGFIQIYLDPALVDIGDKIQMNGVVDTWNEAPILMNYSNFTLLSSQQSVPTPVVTSLENFSTLPSTFDAFYRPYSLQGIVISIDDSYYLWDSSSDTVLKLSPRFYDELAIESLLYHHVNVNGFPYEYQNEWVFALMTVTDVPLTNQEKADIAYDYLLEQAMDSYYYPQEQLALNGTDPYGYGSYDLIICGLNSTYFESDGVSVKSLAEATTLTVPMVIHINGVDFNYTVLVHLLPYEVTTIADFLLAPEGSNHFLRGLIVMAAYTSYGYELLLKDDTGSVLIRADLALVEGDEVEFYVLRNSSMPFVIIEDSDLHDYVVLSEKNELENPPLILSGETFATYDSSNPLIYGTYVELRGFLENEYNLYHTDFKLTDDLNYTLIVNPITYTGFETLFQWTDLEVIIRGFLAQNENGELVLNYIGIRHDVRLPDYTDEERIAMIVTLFGRLYGDKTFTSFEPFILFPTHPILGGNISWELLDSTSDYYDVFTHQFLFTDITQPLTFRLTIALGEISETYLYSTSLNPPIYTEIASISTVSSYEEIYLKGAVVYRDPMFIYLEDTTGIVKVETFMFDGYVGDIVVIKGYVYASDSSNGINGYYIADAEDEEDNPLIAIIARNQNATIDLTSLLLEELASHDPYDSSFYHSYVEVSGMLSGNLLEYDNFILNLGSSHVIIRPANEYIYYQLREELLDATGPVPITLQAFVSEYDLNEECFILYYTGIDAISGTPTYSIEDQLNIIQDYIIDTFAKSYPSGYTGFDLPVTDLDFGSELTYELGIGDDIYVSFATDTLGTVANATTVLIYSTINLESSIRQFFFAINILPTTISTDPLTIAQTIALVDGSTALVEGRIISFVNHPNGYCALIKDATGVLTVMIPYQTYYYDYSMIGQTLVVEGTKTSSSGRTELMATDYNIVDSAIAITYSFTPVSLPDLYQFNLYDPNVYGQPIALTGHLIDVDGGGTYALDLGEEIVIIQAIVTFDDKLRAYLNTDVTITGFFLGKQPLSPNFSDVYALAYTSYDYGNGMNLLLVETDPVKICEIALNQLMDQFIIKEDYVLGETVYLPTYSQLLPSAVLSYTFEVTPEHAELNGYNLSFGLVLSDTVYTIEATLTQGSSQASRILSFVHRGTPINNLDDLFINEPGTLTINLIGTVLMSKWGYSYFLIDDQVYYYEGFIDEYFDSNMQVFITGRKTAVDSIPDYTFGVHVYQGTDLEPEMVPTVVSIADLYANDYALNPLHRNQISVSGTLYYDDFMDMFYLEDNGNILYIRENLTYYEGGGEAFYYHPEIERNLLFDWVCSPITLKLFLPNKFLLNSYMMADFRGYQEDYVLPDLTLEEHVAIAKARFELASVFPPFYAGDYLLDILPTYDDHHSVSLEYSLINPSDSTIIDLVNSDMIRGATSETDIPIRVTFRILDEINTTFITDTFDFIITVEPIEAISLNDFLYAPSWKPYQIEGIIQAMDTEFKEWAIVKDASGRLLVNTGAISESTFGIGDYIRLRGFKETAFYQDYVPYMTTIYDFEVIYSGGVVETSYSSMTIHDILALNYLDMTSFCLPITFTGTVIFSGNYFGYQSYDLREDGFMIEDYDIALTGMTYTEYKTMMDPLVGQTVVVTGYLVGFEYIYQAFDWKLYVTNVEVQP